MKHHRYLTLFIWLFVALGIWLRIDQYLFNRSLWLDEAFFAVNFLNRDFWTILQLPLDYSHSHIAPPGFMLITQFLIDQFGNFDSVIRLYPLTAGILSLIMFALLARATLSPVAVPIAVFLFAVSGSLIDYSTDFKQYSSDVFFTVSLLWLGVTWQHLQLTIGRGLLLLLLGITVVWFSHPAIFILAAIGGYWGLHMLEQRQWKSLGVLTLIGVAWIISTIMMYKFVSNGGIASSPIGEWLLKFWSLQQSYMPNPFTEVGQQWLVTKFSSAFNYPADLGQHIYTASLPVLLFLFGCMALVFKKRQLLFFTTVVIGLTLLLSHFKAYPFGERLILFLVPIFYLVIAEAIAQLKVTIEDYPHQWVSYVAQLALVIALVYPLHSVWIYKQKQEVKPLMQYLQTEKQVQDKLYLYHWAEPAFRYYAPHYGFDYKSCHLISPIPEQEFTKEIDYYRQKHGMQPVDVNQTRCFLGVSESFHQSIPDLNQLKGQGRIWFLFLHHSWEGRDLFLQHLDGIGTRLDSRHDIAADLYLYDL